MGTPFSSYDLTTFNSGDFGSLRVLKFDGEPWFVARGVAKTLGYRNPARSVQRHCKGVTKAVVPSGHGEQTSLIIPESDLYRLVMRSKLPDAERFQDWVVEDVLPAIRKDGAYIQGEEKVVSGEMSEGMRMVAIRLPSFP